MSTTIKLKNIIEFYSQYCKEELCNLTVQNNSDRINTIENLLNEEFPSQLLPFYEQYDGEEGNGAGCYLGHTILGLEEIIKILSYSKTLVKPEKPFVANPEESEKIIEKLIECWVQEIPVRKKFGFIKQKWHKVKFECSPGSLGGPYLYPQQATSDQDRESFNLSDSTIDKIYQLIKLLHQQESENYGWDNMEIEVYSDGKKEVKRSFYNFDDELTLSSFPEGAIRKKYFHFKWFPLISDNSGNYIGIDLDPDINGKKGQVIIFGRDEEEMFVISDSWEDFLDFTLELSQKEEFTKSLPVLHLHEIYKKLIFPDNL